ncbi:MAG: MFS transporter [Crocinitomicaceae bacterium]|nr:MFS transporter [Crocinitomicaceae bacterium]
MSKHLIPAYLLTFVNVLGFSILMPVLPFIVESFDSPEWVYGLLISLYSGSQFIGSPILGTMSDSKGRKPILLISQAGTLLAWLVFIAAILLPKYPILGLSLPIWIIGLSRVFDGITGGNTSVTNAYVSDITTRKEKSYIFGYLGGIAGIGMIIGPGLGGIAASSSIGYLGTLLLSLGISSLTLISIIFWLKESHPSDKRLKHKKISIWSSLYIPNRVKEVNPSPIIKTLFTIKIFFSAMIALYISTVALFLIDLFSFEEKELGLFMLVVGIFLAFNQAFISKIFIKRLGEYRTLIFGLLLCAIGMISITITNNMWLFILFYYVLNLGLSLCFPTFNALIAIHANSEKQGAIMGISESIHSFAMSVFPVLAATVYGLINFQLYYIGSALSIIALSIALLSIKKLKISSNLSKSS